MGYAMDGVVFLAGSFTINGCQIASDRVVFFNASNFVINKQRLRYGKRVAWRLLSK
jgi:hypothetical protein